MITIYKTENTYNTPEGDIITTELRGLSTDTKPTEVAGKEVGNGSIFIEIDTGKIFFFDGENEIWKEA